MLSFISLSCRRRYTTLSYGLVRNLGRGVADAWDSLRCDDHRFHRLFRLTLLRSRLWSWGWWGPAPSNVDSGGKRCARLLLLARGGSRYRRILWGRGTTTCLRRGGGRHFVEWRVWRMPPQRWLLYHGSVCVRSLHFLCGVGSIH